MKFCVNPNHLEAVTQKENVLRGFGTGANFARRSECNKGHKFNKVNTIIRDDGGRRCRICQKQDTKNRDNKKPRWQRMSAEQKQKSKERLRNWQAKQRKMEKTHI